MEEIKQNQLKEIVRNKNGLIEGLNYIFNDDGSINWKSMLPKEFLYINPELKRRERIEKEYKKNYIDIDPIIDNVKDSDLVILLNGLRYLLRVRGFYGIKLTPTESREDYASVNCNIEFIGNYETEGRRISYEDNACAHRNNTASFAQNYLLEIASNRALCRCIRAFLNIGIVSREELGAPPEQEQSKSFISNSEKPFIMLASIMKDKGVKWSDISSRLKKDDTEQLAKLKESNQEAEFIPKWNDKFTSIKDLPKDIIFNFVERLKKIP